MKLYPREQLGFALLYFTGPDAFIKTLQQIAYKKGYILTENGITKLKDNNKKALPCSSEKDIFNILNIKYKNPNERDI